MLEENNTVPFIARYRKEATVVWMKFKSNKFLTNINMLQIYRKEKDEVIHNIEQQGLLTNELKEAILKQNQIATCRGSL